MKTSAIDSARLRTNLKYSQLTNKEIKRICAQRNLSIYGTRHGLLDRLRRYEALPVMYDSWTKPELVSAVSARKIALRKTKADSATEKGHQRRSKIEIFARCRQTLINALEKADREAEFELMEMPPELRLKGTTNLLKQIAAIAEKKKKAA